MLYNGLVLFTQVTLCFVLVLAASSKIAAFEVTSAWLIEIGLKRELAAAGTTVMVASEILIASVVALAPLWGAPFGVAFFTVAVLVLLRARRLEKGCGCFGVMSARIGAAHLLRATALLAGFVVMGALLIIESRSTLEAQVPSRYYLLAIGVATAAPVAHVLSAYRTLPKLLPSARFQS